VGEGTAANRGALPYYRLGVGTDPIRVLVPLPASESLWIALIIRRGIIATGRAGGEPLHIAPISESPDGWAVMAADAVLTKSGPHALDATSFAVIDKREALNKDHLILEMKELAGRTLGRLGVVLGTPELYTLVSGQPAPLPTSENDAYGGWRLP